MLLLSWEILDYFKSGKRLTPEQKTLLIRYLWVQFHEYQAQCNKPNPYVLIPLIHTLAQEQIRCNAFDYTGHSVPHGIYEHDVSLGETSYEEEYDTNISSDTTEKIANLVSACKSFELKIPYNLSET